MERTTHSQLLYGIVGLMEAHMAWWQHIALIWILLSMVAAAWWAFGIRPDN